jgi:hypothetical protein
VKMVVPQTIEECLVAFGLKEQDDEVEVIMSVNLMADICTRLIRVEDLVIWDIEIEEDDE